MKLSATHATLPLQVGLAACLWVASYYLNGWLFAGLEWTQTVSWVFLPAAVRLLVVLLFGGPGACGLWIGTLVTNVPIFGLLTAESLIVASASAVAPFIAVRFGVALLKLPNNLQGVTGTSLLQLAALSAICSAGLHSSLFYALDSQSGVQGIFAMLVGDVVGTLVVLYALRAVLVLCARVQGAAGEHGAADPNESAVGGADKNGWQIDK